MKTKFSALLASTFCIMSALPAAAQEADVMHWWTSGAESKALRVLADAYSGNGGTWKDRAVPDFQSALAAATSSIVNGTAPLALQFNGGPQFRELAESGMLTDLTGFANAEGWADNLRPMVHDAVSHDGKIYALPVDMHNSLWILWSKAAFAKAGVEFPQSWSEFMASLDTLKAAGIVPVAQGGEPWQDMLLFEAVLLYSGKADLYDALFLKGDPAVLETHELLDAASDFLRIGKYLDVGAPGRKWNDTTGLVIRGAAGMQIMGDWALGEFASAGQKPDVDFGCDLGFGTKQYYNGVVDVFVLPPRTGGEAAQALFAKTVMTPAVQASFNAAKGGLPPRVDVTPQSENACLNKAAGFLSSGGALLPNPTATISTDRFGAFADAVSQALYASDAKPEALVEALKTAFQTAQ